MSGGSGRPRACGTVLALVVLAGCAPSAPRAAQSDSTAPRALAAAGERTPAPDPAAAWRSQAQSLRGLAFLRPVEVRDLPRTELGALLRAELNAAMSPAEVDAYRDAYAALGVLPQNLDLLALFVQIYAEQMVGLYSSRESALYLLGPETPAGYARATVAVHELVHALQHQHVPRTVELAERLRHNDDVVSSLSGALEGDASFTMLGADDGDAETERDLASARRFRDAMLVDLAAPSGALLHAPLAVRLGVIVPYAHGVMLAARRYGAGGNVALDALIEDAPLSTAELLDEGRAGGASETEFVRLPLAELERALARQGCALGHHNVAGALGLLALFGERDLAPDSADALVQGWRGDRFVRIDCKAGTELLWLSSWRDADAAARFERAYRSIAAALAQSGPLSGRPAPIREGRRVLVTTPGIASTAKLALAGAELRGYSGLSSWIADGCFGEERGCPLAAEVGSRPLQMQGALGSSDD